MTAVAPLAAPLPQPPVLIDRSELAAEIVRFIRQAASRVMVIHGRLASGKTELMRRWVIPGLRPWAVAEGRDVFYGECTPGLPDTCNGPDGPEPLESLLQRAAIVVLDGFENVFELPRDSRRDAMDHLFQPPQRPDQAAQIVLVTDTTQLANVYALSSYEPAMMGAVFEVRSIGMAEGLEQLSQIEPDAAVVYTEEVLTAFDKAAAHLATHGWGTSVELIRWIDARLRDWRRSSRQPVLDVSHYQRLGGLEGILRSHLEAALQQLGSERTGRHETGLAILERVLAALGRDSAPVFDDIPARTGQPPEVLQSVLAQLTGDIPLLRQLPGGAYEFAPVQLGAVVEQDVAARRIEIERMLRIVEEGLRGWQLLGTFLPRARFEEVHRHRVQLDLRSEEVRFMLQCALRSEGEAESAAEYWLRRVDDTEDAVGILLSTMFSEEPAVRLRAVALLKEFPDSDVKQRLSVVALTDPAPEVRDKAVASLEPMRDDALLERFILEVHDSKSLHRVAAIRALRLFPSDRVAELLQGIVSDRASAPELREEAIRVLPSLGTPIAIDALVDVALNDEDPEDREGAAAALASLGSPDLNRLLLTKLEVTSPRMRIRLTWLGLSLAAMVGTVVFLLAFLVAIQIFSPEVAGLLLWAGLLLSPVTGHVLRQLRDRRLRWLSAKGIVGLTLYALQSVSIGYLLHGFGHALLGRWRRGLSLLALGATGILLVYVANWFLPVQPLIGWVYFAAGVTLFVGTYLYDIVGVLFQTVVFTGTTRRAQRRARIYQQIFRNPLVSHLVFDRLRSGDGAEAAKAASLVRRFGASAQPATLIELLRAQDPAQRPFVIGALERSKGDETIKSLETLWREPQLRAPITKILSTHPTERSLDVLSRYQAEMSLRLRLRSGWARWKYRFLVWPRFASLAAVLVVMTVPFLGYHGVMVFINRAWSQIMTLQSAFADDMQKVNAAGVMADYYADEAAEVLPELIQKKTFANNPVIAASVARGMIRLANSYISKREAIRDTVRSRANEIAELLLKGDSATFARAVADVRLMAATSDTADLNTAVQLLQGLVLVSGSSVAESWKPLAVEAFGDMDYTAALPVLDSLYTLRGSALDLLSTGIASQIEQTTRRAYAELAESDDPAAGARRLDTVLTRMRYQPSPVLLIREQVRKEIAKANQRRPAAEGCDRNHDGVCNEIDNTLEQIAKDQSKEDPYRELLGHYFDTEGSLKAARVFAGLVRQYPRAVWPQKILAELYHENLAVGNPAMFDSSYRVMTSLRKLPAYRTVRADTALWDRFESDFAEVALSAGRYAEIDSLSHQILSHSTDSVHILNLRLFGYMGAVMQGNRDSAATRLAELDTLVTGLSPKFYNAWQYPGTIEFIQRSSLPEPLKASLLKLCKAGYWYDQKTAKEILEENRSALDSLKPG